MSIVMEQILQIGFIKFGEANYKVLSSNFVLFFTLALVFYLALFVKENDGQEEAPKAEESTPAPAPSRSRATSNAGESMLHHLSSIALIIVFDQD